MPPEFRRRLVLPDIPASVIDDEAVVTDFIEQANLPARPNALELLRDQELAPEQFILVAALHLATLEINFGAGWHEANKIYQTPDLEFTYNPSRQQADYAPWYYLSVTVVDVPILIRVRAIIDVDNIDNDLGNILHQLKRTDQSDVQREALEAKRNKLLLKIKRFVIGRIKGTVS
jgi:hypothetical protein